MISLRLLLVFCFGVLSAVSVLAQADNSWTVQVDVSFSETCQQPSPNMSVGFAFNGQSAVSTPTVYPTTSVSLLATVTGTNWQNVNKTFLFQSGGQCSGPSLQLSLSSFTGSTCNSLSGTFAPMEGGTLSYIISFFPALKLTSTVTYDQVALSATCSNSLIWEFARNPSGPWTQIQNASNTTLTRTAANFASLGLTNPYDIFYVRAKDRILTHRISAPEPIDLRAQPPAVTVPSHTNVACHGQTTGAVTLQISSPIIDRFTVSCDNLATPQSPDFQVPNVPAGSPVIEGLSAGNWTFTVQNNNSTSADAYGYANTTVSQSITQPTALSATFAVPLTNGYAVRCNGGATGSITVTGSGGASGYHDYVWSTGATTQQITNLTAGTYTVSLKDANGCIATGQTTLTAPPALQVTASPASSYNGYPVSCWDKADGSATATASGGVAGYSYAWSNGATGTSINGLGVNAYTVIATDANGCTATSTTTNLTAPPPIDFAIDVVSGLTCYADETAILEAKPVLSTIIGTARYAWSTGETTATVTDKGAGAYTLTVSDGQGCSTTKPYTLANPPGYTVSLSPISNYNGSYIQCHNDENGSLATVVRNASNTITTAQSYLWQKDGVTMGEGASLQAFNDLGRGTYRVVITYGTQCKAETTYFLADPDAVSVTAAATTSYNGQAISCHNATDANLRATATGGTGNHTYLWNTNATTPLLTGLGAGAYSVTVTDVNGCTGNTNITLPNPTAVTASINNVTNYTGYGVSCNGLSDGAMTAVANGGTGVYSYNWSNGRNTAAISALSAGDYTITLSDNNGCTAVASQTITEPAAIAVTTDSYKDISCFNGSNGIIRLATSGGAGQYEYSRNNGASWQTSSEFNGLVIGSYTLRVRDGNNCSTTTTQALVQPTALGLTFTNIQPAFCEDPRGTATAVVTGGVGNYTYAWTNGSGIAHGTDAILTNARGGIYTVNIHDGNNCPIQGSVPITSTDGAKATYTAIAATCHDSPDGSAALTITEGDGPFIIHWPDGQSSLQAINLIGNTYAVEITDGHDCTVVEQVIVPAPDALALIVDTFTQPTCYNDCDGALTLKASGGTGAYTYTWNGQSAITQTGLCHGTYPVVVTDINGCILRQDVALAQPAPLAVTLATTYPATCKDGCDGSLRVLATGGNGGYDYSWDNGSTGDLLNNICPDTYGVMVTDVKGCIGSGRVTLQNTPAVPVDLGGSATLCVGQEYTLDAGTGWQRILWSSTTGLSGTAQQYIIEDPGTYWLEVTDSKGCIGQDTFLLATSYDLLKASFMIPQEAVAGDTIVMIDVTWPMPETTEWNFPLAMKKISATDDVIFGQFPSTGTYTVGLAATLGKCYDYIEKQITVIGTSNTETGGRLGYEKLVKTFDLYSNPNNGSFEVDIELAEPDNITLSVWSAQTGMLVNSFHQKGDISYHLHIDLRPLSPGTYILRLDHAQGTRNIRFIVH